MIHVGISSNGDIIIQFSQEEIKNIKAVFLINGSDDRYGIKSLTEALNTVYALRSELPLFKDSLEFLVERGRDLSKLLEIKHFPLYSRIRENDQEA